MFQISVFHFLGLISEHVSHDILGDEWLDKELLAEVKAVCLYLLTRQSECRREMTDARIHRSDRYLPYTEEAENVVYAIRIEESRHVAETSHPPATAVVKHTRPVVRGESPVLSVVREGVWRCSRLSVEVEIFRFLPYIAAVAVHSDRYVAFQNDTLQDSIIVHITQLGVQYELYIIIERHVLEHLILRVGKRFPLTLVPVVVLRP